MGDFSHEERAREYTAHSILKGVLVLSESTGPIQSRLYNASVVFDTSEMDTLLQEFNDRWAHVMEKIDSHKDEKRGIIDCSYEEAKNIISDVFTCLRYILDYNSRFDMVSQLEVSQ
jgi:hypothetical protein